MNDYKKYLEWFKSLSKVKKGFLIVGFLTIAIIAKINKSSSNANAIEIKLNTIKTGDVLIFGTELKKRDCDSIYVEFVSPNKAKLFWTHVWEVNGNSGNYKTEQYSGEYSVEFQSANEIKRDDDLQWALFDSVIVLSNDEYGFDNGQSKLAKKYVIAKNKNKTSNKITGPILFEWLDPINYPSRNGVYASTGEGINQIIIK